MKRWIAFCLVGLLLLSGCSRPKEPEIVYDPAPIKTGEITLGGVPLSGIYSDGEQEYLKGEDVTLSALPQGTLHTEQGDFIPLGYCIPEGYHPYTVGERTYYTAYPLAEDVPEGYEVPTLMYHAVSDDCWGIAQLFVRPSELEKQLQWLQEEGYTTIHFEDLGRVDAIEKPILLTFDDGYLDNYTELFPLLKKYNAKATVFMIMGSVGGWNYLTADQIKEMDASGLVSFQSHTVTHEFLSTRTAEQLEYELAESKRMLAELIGKESFVLCYPTGKYSEQSLEATADHYQFGLLMSGKTYETGDNPLKITRKYIARSTTLDQFIDMVE